jgi:hypothetical protein
MEAFSGDVMRYKRICWSVLFILLLVACGRRDGPPTCGVDCLKATVDAAKATTGAEVSDAGNDLAGTAQAAAATAQAPLNEAATAAAAIGGTAQAFHATLQAASTETQPTLAAAATQAANIAGTIQAAFTTITPPAVVEEADASAVITQYAQEVLGISVTIVRAGGLTNDIDRQINLSSEGDSAQADTAQVAVQTYAALLQGGAGSVSYGSGTVAGDVTVDINSASLGAFSFESGSPVPESEAEALTLVLQTFPGLSNRTFTATSSAQGFAWVAEGQVPGFDVQTKQATLISEKVQIGVVPNGARRSSIYAVVGKGSFATQVVP